MTQNSLRKKQLIKSLKRLSVILSVLGVLLLLSFILMIGYDQFRVLPEPVLTINVKSEGGLTDPVVPPVVAVASPVASDTVDSFTPENDTSSDVLIDLSDLPENLIARAEEANDIYLQLQEMMEDYRRRKNKVSFEEAQRALNDVGGLKYELSEICDRYRYTSFRNQDRFHLLRRIAYMQHYEERVELYEKHEMWLGLALMYRWENDSDKELYYLRKSGLRGRAIIARRSAEKVIRSFRSIGPDFQWPWEYN